MKVLLSEKNQQQTTKKNENIEKLKGCKLGENEMPKNIMKVAAQLTCK